MMVQGTLASEGAVRLSQDWGPGLWIPGRGWLATLCLGSYEHSTRQSLLGFFK